MKLPFIQSKDASRYINLPYRGNENLDCIDIGSLELVDFEPYFVRTGTRVCFRGLADTALQIHELNHALLLLEALKPLGLICAYRALISQSYSSIRDGLKLIYLAKDCPEFEYMSYLVSCAQSYPELVRTRLNNFRQRAALCYLLNAQETLTLTSVNQLKRTSLFDYLNCLAYSLEASRGCFITPEGLVDVSGLSVIDTYLKHITSAGLCSDIELNHAIDKLKTKPDPSPTVPTKHNDALRSRGQIASLASITQANQ